MSTPSDIPAGYPDYGRVDLVSSAPFFLCAAGTGYVNAALSPVLYVGAFPGILLSIGGGNSANRLEIFWYADEAGTLLIGRDRIDIAVGDTCATVLACKSSWMQVSNNVAGGGTDLGTEAFIIGYNTSQRPAMYVTQPALLATALIPVNAGLTGTVDAFFVAPGAAKFRWGFTGASMTIVVRSTDYNGSSIAVWSLGTSIGYAPAGDLELVLPGGHISVACTNNDAAAKSFRVGLDTLY